MAIRAQDVVHSVTGQVVDPGLVIPGQRGCGEPVDYRPRRVVTARAPIHLFRLECGPIVHAVRPVGLRTDHRIINAVEQAAIAVAEIAHIRLRQVDSPVVVGINT